MALVPEQEDAARLLPLLDDPALEVRAAACRALALTGSSEASARLIPLLRSGSPAERAAAVDGLARGPEELLPALSACLRPARRRRDISALGVLGVRATRRWRSGSSSWPSAGACRSGGAALRAAARVPGSRAEVTLFRALANKNSHCRAGGARVAGPPGW